MHPPVCRWRGGLRRRESSSGGWTRRRILGFGKPISVATDILALASALNGHDRRTRGHAERVRAYTDMVAEELRLPPADRDRLRWSALLHDIGKLTVHADILNKPGAPTEQEWEELRRHPLEGARLIRPLADWLGEWSLTVEQHHERFDGLGYPYGLAADQISLGGRIVAVADAFDVMTSARSYKNPLSAAVARVELTKGAGTQFDPAIVRAFLNISIGRLRWAMGPLSWLAEVPLLSRFATLGHALAVALPAALGLGAVTLGGLAATALQHHQTTPPVAGHHVAATPMRRPMALRRVTASPGDRLAVVTWTTLPNTGGANTSYAVVATGGGIGEKPVTFASAATTETMSGLTNGKSYTFSVRAINAMGTGPASAQSNSVTPRGPANAAAGISAKPGNAMAVVTWTAPSNGGSPITSYTITAYAAGVAQTPVAFSSAATTETMSGLVNGTSYTFSVKATNAIGTGPASAQSAAVTPQGPPAAPTAVSASPGNAMAVVTWTAPFNEGSPITSYTITAYAAGVAQTPVTFPSAATTETMSGLVNGTSYTFSVKATNVIGTGPASAQSSPVTPEGAPTAPSGVSATPGDASAVVSWTAPGSNGGSRITSYTITAYAAGVAQTPVTFPSAATTETMSGLVNGTSYTFSVVATNAIGTGPASAQSSPVTPRGPPAAPSGVSATPGNAMAVVSWNAPFNEGSPITSYTITAYAAGVAQTPVAFSSAATSETMSGLVNGTSYTFSVKATNVIGTGPASAQSSPVTPQGPPTAPSAVSATPQDTAAVVSWTAPGSNGGSPITSYTITAYAAGVAQTPVTFPSAATTETMSGLVNGTSYTFSVVATNAVGTGPASAQSPAVTPASVPAAPSAVSASPGNAMAVVTWTAPSNGGSPITSYTITAYAAGVAQTPVAFSSAATTETMSGLVNGTSYTFSVKATNAIGTGPASAQSAAVTPQGPPAAPTAVSASPGNAMAVVTWTAPFNEGSPITSYTITAYAAGVAQTPVTFPSAATTETMSGLVNGTSYTFSVKATNVIGTGPASAQSSPVTPEGAPTAPSGVSATPGDASAVVSWTAPGSNGGSPHHLLHDHGICRRRGPDPRHLPICRHDRDDERPRERHELHLLGRSDERHRHRAGLGPVEPGHPSGSPGCPERRLGNAGQCHGRRQLERSFQRGKPDHLLHDHGLCRRRGTDPRGFLICGHFRDDERPRERHELHLLGESDERHRNRAGLRAVEPGHAAGPSHSAERRLGHSPGHGCRRQLDRPRLERGSPITSYTITAYAAGVAQTPVTFSSAATTETMSGLVNGTSYTFSVVATNAVGTGPASAQSPAVTPASVPAAPSAVSASPGNAMAVVTWTAPSNGGSPITSYTITAYAAGVAQTPVAFSSAATTETMSGLVNGTSYTFSVKATNAIGTGPASAQSAAVTPQGPPAAPTAVSASPGNAMAVVTWTAPFNEGSPITSYTITAYAAGVAQTPVTFPSAATTETMSGLVNGTSYTFSVKATNVIGTGPASAQSSPVTPTGSGGALTIRNGPGNAGRPDEGDVITITFSTPPRSTAFCSSWSPNPARSVLDGPDAVVTGTQLAGPSDDMLTVSDSDCPGGFHFGSIDLGQRGYFNGGHVTFGGTINNGPDHCNFFKPPTAPGCSEIIWNGSNTLTVTLGQESNGQPSNGNPSVAVYTPAAILGVGGTISSVREEQF